MGLILDGNVDPVFVLSGINWQSGATFSHEEISITLHYVALPVSFVGLLNAIQELRGALINYNLGV